MRTTVIACAVATLAFVARPAAAQAQQDTCRLAGADLEREFVREIDERKTVPPGLSRSMQSDDILRAQVYGYLVGRRLVTAPVGSRYRGCALALDTWLTSQFGRYSAEVLTTYRAGLVGKFDALMEGLELSIGCCVPERRADERRLVDLQVGDAILAQIIPVAIGEPG